MSEEAVIGLNGVCDAFGENGFTEEEAKEVTASNLAPAGKWPGQIMPDDIQTKKVETEKGEAALEGEFISRLHVVLETSDGPKHVFFDALPKQLKLTSKKGGSYVPEACTNAGHLYKATKLYGQPFNKVLEAAVENRFIYDIGVKKEREDAETGKTYPAKNSIRGIYPLAKEAA